MSTRNGKALLATALVLAAWPCIAGDVLLGSILEEPGSAGLGFLIRAESSPYVDGGTRTDLLPLYLYEGERFFLRSTQGGVRLWNDDSQGFEAFVERRLEGFPEDTRPASLEGMDVANTGADFGVRYYIREGGSTWDFSLRHDIAGLSHGSEFRSSWGHRIQGRRWTLQPVVTLAWRSIDLNDYYFGVAPDEATVARPAWEASAGWNATAALYGKYRVFSNWDLIGGLTATRLSDGITDSPIVDGRWHWGALAGFSYDFGNGATEWDDKDTPVYVKVFYGRDSAEGCHLARIMTFACTSLNRDTPTAIAGVHFGRPFVTGLNGWPLDLVGYAGVLRHDARGHQPDSWQIDAYMKAYYYGFPWRHRVTTRIGFGFGLSYSERVPYAEEQSLIERGRNTSKLLNYLDPSIDINIGELFRRRDLYLGLGVSHRSGIFASSEMLGTVDGGSNYIYAYLEGPL